jgi:hypothetical protein
MTPSWYLPALYGNVSIVREGLSFLCIPKDVRKIRAWVKAVNRDGWIPNN